MAICPRCGVELSENIPVCSRCNFDIHHGIVTKPNLGKCIYCEKECKLTDEHIFGDWLAKAYPRKNGKSFHKLTRPNQVIPFETQELFEIDEKPKKGFVFEQKVRNVCAACNSGWMSRLQNNAKPLITALANGEQPFLSDIDKKLIAQWATMISINLQCHGRILKTPQFQRTELMNGEVPNSWVISIGTMRDQTISGRSWYRPLSLPLLIEENEYLFSNSTYFVIEFAVFHTFNSLSSHLYHLFRYSGVKSPFEVKLPTRRIYPDPQPYIFNGYCGLTQDNLDEIQEKLITD